MLLEPRDFCFLQTSTASHMKKSVNLLYGLHILGCIGIGLKGGENKRMATTPFILMKTLE